jgi:hypothetical protein
MIWPNTVKKTLATLANAFGISTTGKSAATLASDIAAAAGGSGEEADATALAALATHEAAADPHSQYLTQAEADARYRLQSTPLPLQPLVVAVSDETTAITAGTGKTKFRMPYAFTLTGVRASLSTASTSGVVTVDVNEGGTSILGASKLSIDANETTSSTAATPADLSDTTLADDAEITIDIDAAGTGAKGLKVTLLGRPA